MSDKHSDQTGATPAADPSGGGRRGGERRQNGEPFAGPDRRKAERRTGADRRTTPRSDFGDADEG